MTVGPRRLIALVAVLALAVVAWTVVRIWSVGERDEHPPADAIVVLGSSHDGPTPSAVYRARLEHAVELYRAGVAPILLVSGGGADPLLSEAAVGRDFARDSGIPASAILTEEASRNTQESLTAAGAILRARGLDRVVFVSDRSHMFRVLLMAADQGLTAFGSPTATSPSDATVTDRILSTVHELGGLAAYFVGAPGPGSSQEASSTALSRSSA
jgi:uncharacterized SAM-binding protein YcdF (DUF218 family)